ncbi:calcineurin B homologous protein 1 [Exaiptasia diaphana]|uniref:EF-hand domain-containing protein n=1 Tax=Exaiptasia diaphana TaxID=2652724 RepID=A0A913XJ22_EXADI|nr:calcineurin B homologous protein 1 [Exaiptasia diaphana]KXJ25796.1 Calcineurin B-likeous protein 1 [Exaiptasia diaphana]
MGLKSSTLLQEEDIEEIQRETGFSPKQITRLYSRFLSLDKGNQGTLSREDFLRIPELAINPLGDRIVDAFFMHDNNADEFVECNFKQFVKTLAHFRPYDPNTPNLLNSRDEKLKFTFRIYDIDSDGKVSKDDLLSILHMMVGVSISDEQLGAIAERALTDAGCENGEAICFDVLKKVMKDVDLNAKMSIRFLA